MSRMATGGKQPGQNGTIAENVTGLLAAYDIAKRGPEGPQVVDEL